MQNDKDISIVIPVYNSAKSLLELINRIKLTMFEMNKSYEIIFVDDYSKDTSWEILKEIQSSYPFVIIIKLARNFGQHNATLCGIKESSGKVIVTIDDDLEHPPEKIAELYQDFLNGRYDVYYASPIKREKKFIRNFSSNLWAKASQYSKKGIGKASSFRLIKKEIAQCLVNHREPFVYIEAIIFWYTKNIGYKEINFDRRKYGNSNYSMTQLYILNHDLGMHYDTHILKFMKNFGVAVFFSSMGLIIFYLLKKIYGHVVPGYSSIIIVLLFSTGTLFWGMGYLGIYIGKMFRILNKEPQYKIAEKIDKRD